jgi:hypothetical protein
MAMEAPLAKYVAQMEREKDSGVDKSWKNVVRRSWNALLKPEGGNIAKGVLMSELDAQDRIFTTHFKDASGYFMTGSREWTDIWPVYVDAIIRQADTVAERPELNPSIQEVREHLPGKIRFALLDHGEFRMAPPFPLITRSVVPVMVQALDEIKVALYEVSRLYPHTFRDTPYIIQVECVRLGQGLQILSKSRVFDLDRDRIQCPSQMHPTCTVCTIIVQVEDIRLGHCFRFLSKSNTLDLDVISQPCPSRMHSTSS